MLDTLKIFLLPPEPLYSHIKNLKLELREAIGNYFYWDYEPHISLVYLKAAAGHAEPLAESLASMVSGTASFDISLNKITAPGRGLIFVDVDKSLPLRALTNQLHQGVKEYLSASAVPHEDFEKYLRHHITIGNYIKGEKYEAAKKVLSSPGLPQGFEARRVVLYREEPSSRKNVLVREFDLGGS